MKSCTNYIDEIFSGHPEYLNYNIICHKCNKKPIDCKCKDKWYRLHEFHSKLVCARANRAFDMANKEERDLVDKFGI